MTLLPFRTAKLVWSVDAGGSATAQIDLLEEHVLTGAWTPPARIVIHGPRDWGGEVTQLAFSGPPSEREKVGYTASLVGLAHRLDYRVVRHDLVVNDNADVIVAALLSEAQDNQFNGDMGFTMGFVSAPCVSRLRTYCVGVNIGDAIRELASIGRGFDWEVDPNGVLNIWNRSRGVFTGKTLYQTQTEGWEVTLDTSEMLTNVTAIADPSDPFGPKYRMSRTAMADDFGRRELSIDTDIVALNQENPDWEQELYDAGDALLQTQGGAHITLHTTWLASKAPWNFGDVWLQDRIDVAFPAYLGGTQRMRCTDITVSIEAMPPRGVDAPDYWVEMSWDGLTDDVYVIRGDPDQGDPP